MITHAAPQKHYTVLLSRPVRVGFLYYARFFRKQNVTVKYSARYRLMTAPAEQPR